MARLPSSAETEQAVLEIYAKFGVRPGEGLMHRNIVHCWDSVRYRMEELESALHSLGDAEALYTEDGKSDFIFLSESGFARINQGDSTPLPGELKMPLSSLANDNVELLKKDGNRIPNLKASVQKSKIFMGAANLLVERGDLILRKMSNGAEETYEVLDPGFYEKIHGIDAHYQMDVKKLGVPEAEKAVQNITYNISGNNARINQNSVDNSSNVVNIDARAVQYVKELRSEVQALDIDEADKADALAVVDEVEKQIECGSAKKPILSALLASLPAAANITTIVASLLSLF